MQPTQYSEQNSQRMWAIQDFVKVVYEKKNKKRMSKSLSPHLISLCLQSLFC